MRYDEPKQLSPPKITGCLKYKHERRKPFMLGNVIYSCKFCHLPPFYHKRIEALSLFFFYYYFLLLLWAAFCCRLRIWPYRENSNPFEEPVRRTHSQPGSKWYFQRILLKFPVWLHKNETRDEFQSLEILLIFPRGTYKRCKLTQNKVPPESTPVIATGAVRYKMRPHLGPNCGDGRWLPKGVSQETERDPAGTPLLPPHWPVENLSINEEQPGFSHISEDTKWCPKTAVQSDREGQVISV